MQFFVPLPESADDLLERAGFSFFNSLMMQVKAQLALRESAHLQAWQPGRLRPQDAPWVLASGWL